MCKHRIKKLSFVTRYLPYQYNTHQMCDKASFENGETLTFYLAGDAGAL